MQKIQEQKKLFIDNINIYIYIYIYIYEICYQYFSQKIKTNYDNQYFKAIIKYY